MGITKIEKFSEIKREKSWLRIKVFLQILTWRTHQIRYHLSEKGLPIVWDYLYGEESNEPLQLTAYKIQYLNLNGEMKVIEI
jgi:23S rRNA-/tRNA-specific pseudouridylate synthase